MIFARFLSVISLGARPLNPGIATTSSALFSLARAEPNFTFRSSACFLIMAHPALISSVIISPPKGITAVCLIIPSRKMATSVVPPPMSTSTTPFHQCLKLPRPMPTAAESYAEGCNLLFQYILKCFVQQWFEL